MKSLVNHALAEHWCESGVLEDSVYRLPWFVPTFSVFASGVFSRSNLHGSVDEASVGRAFFEWVGIVEQSEHYASVDPIDHAHYICGRLLRCLLVARPLRIEPAVIASGDEAQDAHSLQSVWPEGYVNLAFVCTLLQAFRLQSEAGPLSWHESRFDSHWRSFRENAVEDPDCAGPFLDFFLGLDPVWDYPVTPTKRPAALRAAG